MCTLRRGRTLQRLRTSSDQLHYLATDDVIFTILESWLLEWRASTSFVMEAEKSIAQRKNDKAKLWMAQLAEKRRNEAAIAKAQVAWDVAKVVEE